ncbi:hypothetical protein CROQUDRAFT_52062 [Cronartium quercuum f. sp. fusiforme G11]|uniref:Kinetochore protein SPC25 n=1 Tax=Cronartium quercuum f. sp. fusiforme G11 TaxID=708437 RepID=A0A9P6NCH6_9BASI|nr:hypothetical protein CROQUDRAFT_52062 [Cronartium quercuum f. sp. fusiforme G11]
MSPPPAHFNNQPATPLRFPNVAAGFTANGQPSSALRVPHWLASPSKKRQMLLGTPPITRTPSRAPAPPTPARVEQAATAEVGVTPLPQQIIGRDPDLLIVLENHQETLDRVTEKYRQMKVEAAHTLHAELAACEHERTQAKCQLAVVQKQLAEGVEVAERLKNEVGSAKKRLRGLVEDRRTMELKLSELKEVVGEFERRKEVLENQNKVRKKELVEVLKMAKEEAQFLEEITGMRILLIGVDRLRFEFTMIDLNHYDRPFVMDLDLSSTDYKILALKPSLPEAHLLLKQLNQSRDFNRFLCGIKKGFNQAARTQ